MGPETYERAPSAEKFKRTLNFWRPSAALALTILAAVVYNEDHKASNPTAGFKDYSTSPEALSLTNGLPSEKMFDNLVVGQVTISQLLQQPDKTLEINIVNSNSLIPTFPELVSATRDEHLENLEITGEAATVRSWLEAAGWPKELIPQAEKVIFCESRNRPEAINHAENPIETSYGLFQLIPLWFDYAGEDFENWSDPVVNARVAYKVYRYDIDRGQAPWTQWGCKP